MKIKFGQFKPGSVKLKESPYRSRFDLNVTYVKALTSENLLRNFYLQAGLWSYSGSSSTSFDSASEDHAPMQWHWGWESPTCELRGHFLGHWLSAAAHVYVQTGDEEIKAKTAFIVRELARCQQANGGEWVGAIPEVYMERMLEGRQVWAPHYVVHKLFMGLNDVYRYMNITEALEISDRFSDWFYKWTESFSREQMDFVLDYETGGMLEAWADLYELTGKRKHKELIERYDRPRFFDGLLRGQDVLTNKHANTQIAEILGAARAWEVTGEKRWRDIVLAFWQAAVEERGTYATGGVSCGELWTPPHQLASRLGLAQEHCVVYNMMRVAQFLFRWTGDSKYADFWERNLVNGVLAQQNKHTGMISYFLEMAPGSKKNWGSETKHFWCCHGTLVQAHATYDQSILYHYEKGLVVSQFIPTYTNWNVNGTDVQIAITQDSQNGAGHFQTFHDKGYSQIQHVHVPKIPNVRPDAYVYELGIQSDKVVEFELKVRIPWWVKGMPIVRVNGEEIKPEIEASFLVIHKGWKSDLVTIECTKQLTTVPLPDKNDMVVFMDGPLVLAGLVDEERQLVGDIDQPETILVPHNERHHSFWRDGSYKTINQERNIKFIPLLDVTDETYTVYFPIKKAVP